MNARADSGATDSDGGGLSAASHDNTTSATASDLSTLPPYARSVFEAVAASGTVLHGGKEGGDYARLDETAFIELLQDNRFLFEAESEVGIHALDGKRCKSIKMSEQKVLGLCGAPLISAGAGSRSLRLAICSNCRDEPVEIQNDDGSVSKRAGRLVIGQSEFLLCFRDSRGRSRSAMMEATEVMYLLEVLRSKKEGAESYDYVEAFSGLMETLMDSRSDLSLDSMSMADASDGSSWLHLFLETDATVTNRRILVRHSDMSMCWEHESLDSEHVTTVDFYEGDSANLSSVEGRVERGLASRPSLDGPLVMDLLGGDVSFDDVDTGTPAIQPPVPPASAVGAIGKIKPRANPEADNVRPPASPQVAAHADVDQWRAAIARGLGASPSASTVPIAWLEGMKLNDSANVLLPETLLILYKLQAPIESLMLMSTEVFITMGIGRDQAARLRQIMIGKGAREDVRATAGPSEIMIELERRGVDLATRSMLRAVTKDLTSLRKLNDANPIFGLVTEDQMERIRPLLTARPDDARSAPVLPVARKASATRTSAAPAVTRAGVGRVATVLAHARHTSSPLRRPKSLSVQGGCWPNKSTPFTSRWS